MAEATSAHALAALSVVMSLMQALAKRGLIDHTVVDATLADAGTYAQALCADYPREVEREVQRLLVEIGKVATQVAPPETPVPLVDPA